eukprot:6559563-Pyramimonas_sp.AAC.1
MGPSRDLFEKHVRGNIWVMRTSWRPGRGRVGDSWVRAKPRALRRQPRTSSLLHLMSFPRPAFHFPS